ncbi:hypothetical protein XELAEV_18005982mg, partial [Xenopus laevis]
HWKCRPETGSADPHQSAAIQVRTVISECTPPDPYPTTSCGTLRLREDTCTDTCPATDTGSQKCRPHVRHHLYLKATASASINRIVWGIHSRSYFTHPSTAIPGSRHTLEAISSWTRTRPPYPSDPTTTLVGKCDYTRPHLFGRKPGYGKAKSALQRHLRRSNRKCAPDRYPLWNKTHAPCRYLRLHLASARTPHVSPCGPEPNRLPYPTLLLHWSVSVPTSTTLTSATSSCGKAGTVDGLASKPEVCTESQLTSEQ